MTSPQPLELAQALRDEVHQFQDSVTHWDSHSKFRYLSLERKLQAFQATNVVEASLLRAILSSSIGNFEDAESWFVNAERNGAIHESCMERLHTYVNHGFASRALGLTEVVLANRLAYTLMDLASAVTSCGAFQKIVEAVENSIQRREVLQMTSTLELARQAVAAQDQLQLSDSDIALVLDEAGALLRANRLLWQGGSLDISILTADEGGPSISMEYRVDISAQEAARMNWSLAEALVDKNLYKAGLHIGFLGTALEERLAA